MAKVPISSSGTAPGSSRIHTGRREGPLAKFMVTRATARRRDSKRWAPVLLKALRTRGVRATT
jgi:hypothetical protein